MELIKRNRNFWDPFDLLEDLQTDLNRVFDRSLTRRRDWQKSFAPEIDVEEEKDRYVVHADLPGLSKENINISVEANLLTIKGERKTKDERKEKGYYYSERFYGAFQRSIELPVEIKTDQVKASYKDGVLEVTLPKAEGAKPKQINVDVR